MGEWGSLTFQLPSVREGYVGPSSSEFQALREAGVVLSEGYAEEGVRSYVRWLLEQRQAAEAERSRLRAQREARWAEVAAGERPGLSVDQACALWTDKASEQMRGGKKQREARGAFEPYERLADAIEKVAARPSEEVERLVMVA